MLSPKYYLLTPKIYREYYKVHNIRYVLIDNIDLTASVKIYYGNSKDTFSIISKENNQIKIDLKTVHIPEKLLFYIEGDTSYTISLYSDKNFNNKILSKKTTYEKILIPDGSWIIPETSFITYNTYFYYDENELTTLTKEYISCSYQEKYVYKYKTIKDYYDDKYYANIEGYTKDEKDYKIYYKEKPITNTVEIIQEKVVSVPKIEYITIEKQNKENDSSKPTLQCKENTIVKTQKEIVEKEVIKVPKKMYIIIMLLILSIILLLIKIIKKMSNEKNRKYCRKQTKR